jgi:hypothetical protein
MTPHRKTAGIRALGFVEKTGILLWAAVEKQNSFCCASGVHSGGSTSGRSDASWKTKVQVNVRSAA